MVGSRRGPALPTQLGLGLFEQFVLPHLSTGRRGPPPKLGLFKIFNYILQLLYLGCQWKELPIDKDGEGRPEIHYTRIYSPHFSHASRRLHNRKWLGCIIKLT